MRARTNGSIHLAAEDAQSGADKSPRLPFRFAKKTHFFKIYCLIREWNWVPPHLLSTRLTVILLF